MHPAPHLVTFRVPRPETLTIDDDGRATRETAEATCYGHAAVLSAREADLAARYGVSATAVVNVPLVRHEGPVIDDSATVVLEDELGPDLAGEWTIAAVRATPLHRRVLLRRAG
jgi:hypothetical protein